jgi:hypothetical protein
VPAGEYRVAVIDSEGCLEEVDTSFTIHQPDELILLLKSHQNPWEISEKNDGYIRVEPRGGTGEYEFKVEPIDQDPTYEGEEVLFYFTDEEPGIYKVSVNDENGCGPVSITFEIQINTSIATESGIEVKLYPNPTSGLITLEMPIEDPEADLEVLNMTGQLVIKKRIYSSGGIINETLDLSDQAKGLYMIRIDGQALQSAVMVK